MIKTGLLLLFFFCFAYGYGTGVKGNIHCSTKSYNCTQIESLDDNPPRLFYQLGEPRSASTYQFNALCATVMIKYGHQGVSCRFLFYDPRKRINVVKSHIMDSFQPAEPNYIFIASTRSGQIPRHGGIVHFLMYFEDLLQKGDAIMAYYRDLFGLTQEQYIMLHEYMHYWQIIRKCCSKKQSSASFVHELEGGEPTKKIPFFYNDCKLYDLEEVGRTMKNTTFCQVMKDNAMCPGPQHCHRSVTALQAEGEKIQRLRKEREEREEKERKKEEEKKEKEEKEEKEGMEEREESESREGREGEKEE